MVLQVGLTNQCFMLCLWDLHDWPLRTIYEPCWAQRLFLKATHESHNCMVHQYNILNNSQKLSNLAVSVREFYEAARRIALAKKLHDPAEKLILH